MYLALFAFDGTNIKRNSYSYFVKFTLNWEKKLVGMMNYCDSD